MNPDQFESVTDLSAYRERKSRDRHPSRTSAFLADQDVDPFSMGNPRRLRQHLYRAHGVTSSASTDETSMAVKHRSWHEQYPESFDHSH